MNIRISDEITDADARAGSRLRALSFDESKDVRDKLAAFYGGGKDGRFFSYQTMRDADGFRASEGWRLLPDFIGKGDVLFFLNPDEAITVWRCPSAEWLRELLADCFGFPFYVVSVDLESLFCFDDHDCVIVAGNAKTKLSQFKSTDSP